MNDYIKDICKIITHGRMENTYKMSWIRSIVETCEKCPKEEIHFDELSPLIFKYYWNQCIYFNLRQSPNYKKKISHYIIKNTFTKKPVKNEIAKIINKIL